MFHHYFKLGVLHLSQVEVSPTLHMCSCAPKGIWKNATSLTSLGLTVIYVGNGSTLSAFMHGRVKFHIVKFAYPKPFLSLKHSYLNCTQFVFSLKFQ